MIQLTSLIIVPITLGQLGLGIHGFVDFQHLDPVWRVCLPSPVSQNSQQYLELSKQLSWGFPGRALGYLTSYPGSPMTFDCCLSHQQCTCEASPLQGHLPTTPTLLGAQMLGPYKCWSVYCLKYRHPSIHLHDFYWESPTFTGIL